MGPSVSLGIVSGVVADLVVGSFLYFLRRNNMPFQSMRDWLEDDDDEYVDWREYDPPVPPTTKEKILKIFRFKDVYVIARTLSDARKMIKGINAEQKPDLVVPVKEGRIWL